MHVQIVHVLYFNTWIEGGKHCVCSPLYYYFDSFLLNVIQSMHHSCIFFGRGGGGGLHNSNTVNMHFIRNQLNSPPNTIHRQIKNWVGYNAVCLWYNLSLVTIAILLGTSKKKRLCMSKTKLIPVRLHYFPLNVFFLKCTRARACVCGWVWRVHPMGREPGSGWQCWWTPVSQPLFSRFLDGGQSQ